MKRTTPLICILAIIIGVSGCQTVPKLGESTSTQAPTRLIDQKFSVSLSLGRRIDFSKTHSTYQIEALRGIASHITIPSALSLESIQTLDDPDLSKLWKTVVDEEDHAATRLLIEEDVPNDCGPCKNYAWITRKPNGAFECRFLTLPERTTGSGGIDYEFPTVTRLSASTLTMNYSDGKEFTVNIDSLPKKATPTHPG
jgi:hypothetical protein